MATTQLTTQAVQDATWIRYLLITIALAFIALFLCLPLILVMTQAFAKGLSAYWSALLMPDTLSAMRLTLFTAFMTVPLNTLFGIAAAWAITRFEFVGKSLLTTLIDLPFSVSPVISGLIFVLLFGIQGWFGEFLSAHDIKIIFAVPGIIIVTAFITFPFVARELIPLMQEMGHEEEEAALSLGASGLKTFFLITLPNIKWALLYGVLLCNARAMGEFGAVSVVSGHIRGITNTLPLHVEVSYNEYDSVAAFASASILAGLAIVTLILKSFLEWQMNRAKYDNNETTLNFGGELSNLIYKLSTSI